MNELIQTTLDSEPYEAPKRRKKSKGQHQGSLRWNPVHIRKLFN